MSLLSGTLLLLLGILLVVVGVVLVLVSGFDLLFGAGGLILIAAGAALLWKNQGAAVVAEPSAAQGERSRQKPLPDAPRSRYDKKI